MEEKVLFELKDISQQLTKKQIEELKHVIYMAKETKELQEVKFGEYGKPIIVCPSGKLMLKPEEQKICASCNQEVKPNSSHS